MTFAAAGETALWQPGSTLLDRAEPAGIDAPWSCRAGRCGTCATRLVGSHVTDAARSKEAGVPVTLRPHPGTHGFIRLHNLVDTAGQAVRDVVADLRALCSTTPG